MTYNLDFSSNACNIPVTGMDVAISAETFDPHSPLTGGIANPNRNSLCGKTLQITHPTTGAQVMATIVDRKASGSPEAIDVSQSVFAALGVDSALGHCEVTWAEPSYP
ncbi:uncharacterized protein RCC_01049 [Ramularia collo-cygni]|uniref:Barwin domain-containing protein n=1 Tax=Ramularia collo-cygni TaxID=112498 RepID=A0A2D3UMD7_9PEZI|nr:uncharacterized protein RCC_01049 [Ramularia collo-cygni]CZT15161.1 uncharacterized protein RCC_01049 [Ramularia collo-cygni]